MTDPTTIRSLLEQGVASHFHTDGIWVTAVGTFPTCEGCGEIHPCLDRVRYEAALALLDNAPRGLGEYTYHVGPECRLVPDPASDS